MLNLLSTKNDLLVEVVGFPLHILKIRTNKQEQLHNKRMADIPTNLISTRKENIFPSAQPCTKASPCPLESLKLSWHLPYWGQRSVCSTPTWSSASCPFNSPFSIVIQKLLIWPTQESAPAGSEAHRRSWRNLAVNAASGPRYCDPT